MQAQYDPSNTVVLDTGADTIKAGFGGNDHPSLILPTVLGRKRKLGTGVLGAAAPLEYIGHDALAHKGILDLLRPVEREFVTNWEGLERIWSATLLQRLAVDPSKVRVLLATSPMRTNLPWERMAEIMFERINVQALAMCDSAVLALIAQGRVTGVVLDSGYGVTHSSPVYEGYTLPHAIQTLHIGGRETTEHLSRALHEQRGLRLPMDLVRELKEQHCEVTPEARQVQQQESLEGLQKKIRLPDGQEVVLGKERFQCTEVLFQPELLSREEEGAHKVLFNCIMRCDVDIRRDLYRNIVLSGGNSLFAGFRSRLRAELAELAPASVVVDMIAHPERNLDVWRGGSTYAAVSNLEHLMFTRAAYEEEGPRGMLRKKA